MNEYIPSSYPLNLLHAIKGKSTIVLPQKLTDDVLSGITFTLSQLNEWEQTILKMRFQDNKPLEIIAKEYRITDEQVRQLEVRALQKMRYSGKWNYIQYGIAGYCNYNAHSEYNKGYSKGYADGYDHGKSDGLRNVDFSYGPEDLLAQPLEYLNLSTRAYQCVHFKGCKTIGDLVRLSEEEIWRTRNLGKKTAAEIAQKLRDTGVKRSAWDVYL